jgi:hypothetical protein
MPDIVRDSVDLITESPSSESQKVVLAIWINLSTRTIVQFE